MRRFFNKKRQNNKGFTLVELVIVVAILAILVGLLAPQYTKYVERSRKAADAENLEEMVKAFQVVVADQEGAVETGDYILTITTKKTTFEGPSSGEGSITNSEDENYGDLYSAMCAILGDGWLSTSLKSNNWTDLSTIYARLTVEEDGGVTVEYNPNQLKTLTVS